MPFPLAHPAAVLPLRRYCPRHLSLPALVIGSLTPDLGYAFGHQGVWRFSHGFLAGSFGFSLPVGLVLVLAFYALRSRLVEILPAPYAQAVLPLCQQRIASPFVAVFSLLIGAWTHIILDSVTHEDGWLVQHVAILQMSLPWVGSHKLAVYDLLYAGCTFAGVAWVTLCYLSWLETVAHPATAPTRNAKWGWTVSLASVILLIATTSREPYQWIGIIPAGIITVLLVVGFLVGIHRSLSVRPSIRAASKRYKTAPLK